LQVKKLKELSKLCIHFIDDEEDILNILRLGFRKVSKQNVITFKYSLGYQEMIQSLEELTNDQFLVVITDINMPDYSGFDLIEKVQELRPENTIFYILSAYDRMKYIERAEKLNVKEYLKKPIDSKKIREILSKDLKDYGFETEL
jgi:DNA-binding NtrC family response regulator